MKKNYNFSKGFQNPYRLRKKGHFIVTENHKFLNAKYSITYIIKNYKVEDFFFTKEEKSKKQKDRIKTNSGYLAIDEDPATQAFIDFMVSYATTIKKGRKENGWSRREYANLLGAPCLFIKQIEKMQFHKPNFLNIRNFIEDLFNLGYKMTIVPRNIGSEPETTFKTPTISTPETNDTSSGEAVGLTPHEHVCELRLLKPETWIDYCPRKGYVRAPWDDKCEFCQHFVTMIFADKNHCFIESVRRNNLLAENNT